MALGKAGQPALYKELKTNLDPVIAALGGIGDDFYLALSTAITNWIQTNGIAAVSLTAANTQVSTIVATVGSATAQAGTGQGTGTLIPKSGVGDVL